ncbi:MAG: hypothetical protein QM398_03165 [Thermoproteota archaeon]|nr:hypothetical protein [Thermoproteota archaeon]
MPLSPVIEAKISAFQVCKMSRCANSRADINAVMPMANLTPNTSLAGGSSAI